MATLTGDDQDNVLEGNPIEHDNIYGLGGNDHLVGYGGSDALYGGDGNDNLSGLMWGSFDDGDERDSLFGGAGDDMIFSGYRDIVDGGEGFDTVGLSYFAVPHGITGDTAILHRGEPLVPGGGTFQSIERFSDIQLTRFDDKMVIGDQSDPATVRGWDGNDHLTGQLVGVTFYGGYGSDLLVGSTSDDVLYGEYNDDRLIGYIGADELWGGEGADRFILVNLDLEDRIGDFTRGEDLIDLSDLDANSLLAGRQAFTFIGNASFSGTAGELRGYSGANSSYFVAGDVDGDKNADLVVEVSIQSWTGSQLTSSDFLLGNSGAGDWDY